VRERELMDNMQLLRQGAELQQKERKIQKLREQYQKLGLEGYEE